ncbi:hypothetical protein KP509_26G054100 [Ceratopteris richardii]|uniref:Uncharacterized protein n=1 Tax=Ceratopteris richardii TaxID=49495 RepID=A0A8T2RMC3_CERRI|nr:hypothetical protein KP509_26G054100 [Ceratopteris richardii]
MEVSSNTEKGSYRTFTGSIRQFPKTMFTEVKQRKSIWSGLARKAKSVLLDDEPSVAESETNKSNINDTFQSQCKHARSSLEANQQCDETPTYQRRLVAITSSLSNLGGTIGNALEESWNAMEAKLKAADLSSRKTVGVCNRFVEQSTSTYNKNSEVSGSSFKHKEFFSRSIREAHAFLNSKEPDQNSVNILPEKLSQQDASCLKPLQQFPSKSKPNPKGDSVLRPLQQHPDNLATDKETQLKASRDVAMAMAAKAKLLFHELKEARADLALAKEHCAQLKEENRMIRTNIDDGLKPDEEDLVRVQLETLLAEKARLAQENAYYARENHFLREMIEYHRQTMQSDCTAGEESLLDAMETFGSDSNDLEETEEFPPETTISTIIN